MSEPTPGDLEQLIADFEASGLRELHVRHEGFELYLSHDAEAPGLGGTAAEVRQASPGGESAAVPESSAAPTATVSLPAAAEWPSDAVVVEAPYLGTFYRSPKPGSPAYVEVGQTVAADSELCLVEVMKLFTAVRSGTAGTVHAILAKDGEMVAADQPLFVIVPAS